MAKVKPIKPEKPVDLVAYEPVILAVSKARAMAWTLEQLGDEHSGLFVEIEDEDTRGWLHGVVAEALGTSLDEIEREYRKLGTNLLAKEAAALAKASSGNK